MPTVAVLLVDALLTTVSWPDTGPAACGSKFTSIVTAEVGFKVTGKVAPEIVKPVPLKVAELIVTGAVPVDVSVTGSVDGVFNVTFPKVKLAVLMDKAATFAAAAFSCIEKVLETPPALAVKVTACDFVTGDAVAVNPTLVSFAGTVTMAGTATAALPLLKLTLKPLLPAAKVRVTVQASVPALVREASPQEIALNAAETGVPVPALVALPPEELPQPETATATKEHVDKANSFAHRPSSTGSALRRHREHEPSTGVTRCESTLSLQETKKELRTVLLANFRT